MTIESYNRKAVFHQYDDKGNFVEITDWANGEGKDIRVCGVGGRNQDIALTHEEFDAVMVAWHWKGK